MISEGWWRFGFAVMENDDDDDDDDDDGIVLVMNDASCLKTDNER